MIISFVTNCKVWKNKRDKNELDKSMELISCFFTIFRSRHVEKKRSWKYKVFSRGSRRSFFSLDFTHKNIPRGKERWKWKCFDFSCLSTPSSVKSKHIEMTFLKALNIWKQSKRKLKLHFFQKLLNMKKKKEIPISSRKITKKHIKIKDEKR